MPINHRVDASGVGNPRRGRRGRRRRRRRRRRKEDEDEEEDEEDTVNEDEEEEEGKGGEEQTDKRRHDPTPGTPLFLCSLGPTLFFLPGYTTDCCCC